MCDGVYGGVSGGDSVFIVVDDVFIICGVVFCN